MQPDTLPNAQPHIDRPWRWLFIALIVEILIIAGVQLLRGQKVTSASEKIPEPAPVVPAVEAIAFSDERLALAGRASLRLYEQGQLIHEFEGYDHPTRNRHIALAFSPDGTTLATLVSDTDSDKMPYATLKLWNVESGILAFETTVHQGGLNDTYFAVSLAYSPDGHWLATGAGDGHIVITEADSGEMQTKMFNYSTGTHALTFSADGQYLSVISHTGGTWSASHQSGSLEVWDLHDLYKPSLINAISLSPFSLEAAAISPDGRLFVGAESYWEERISFVQVMDRRTIGKVSLHATATAFSPSGDLLAYQQQTVANGRRQFSLHVARWEGEGDTFQLVDVLPARELEKPGLYHLSFQEAAQGLMLNFIPVDRHELVQWNLDTGAQSSIRF